jgi:ribosome-associated translation inhibitor RaiA
LKIYRGGASFRIAMHGQGVEIADEVRSLVEDRLRRDLRAFAGRIVVAHVRLWAPTDGNAPVTCHVRIELRPSGGLALGETGSNLTMAVDRASERMKTALGSQLARQGAAVSQAWLR